MKPLTFQDHYELWLKENNQTKEVWNYERWINEYCFKDICGGRNCNTCEIGGCDHGIEVTWDPNIGHKINTEVR